MFKVVQVPNIFQCCKSRYQVRGLFLHGHKPKYKLFRHTQKLLTLPSNLELFLLKNKKKT